MTNPIDLGGVDLVAVKKTVERYFLSGDWNPSVVSTLGISGTLFIMNNDNNVQYFMKEDDGNTTNWTRLPTMADISGLTFKDACRLATIAPHTLTGLGLVDGLAPLAGDRILVKDQFDPIENGIYIAGAGPWLRAADFNAPIPVLAASVVPVAEGGQADTLWILTTNNPIVIGVSLIAFVQFGAMPVYVSEKLIKYVDIGNGSDATGDGTKYKPFQTITAALAAITDAATGKRYMIRIAAGVYPEVLTWKDFVSAIGDGFESTRLTGAFTHTALPAGISGRMTFTGLAFDGAMTLNHQLAGSNINIRFFHCRLIGPTYNGPAGPYGIASAGNWFLHSCFVLNAIVNDAALHMYEGGAILGSLTINDGTDAFAELVGVYLQGAITLTGRARLYTFGCLNNATITGVNASGVDPLWETDDGSMTFKAITQPLRISKDDNRIVTVTAAMSPYQVKGSESVILADTSGGPIAVTLLPPGNFVGGRLTIKKIDPTVAPNDVTIGPSLDGAPVVLTSAPGSLLPSIDCISEGIGYRLI